MKILMVNKFLYSRGGCENYMLALGEHLEKLGHEVSYFGMYDTQNTVGNAAGKYTQNMDFHSTGFARFLYPFKIIYSIEARKKLIQVIDHFKPDIIHMNNINFQLTPSIIYGAKKKGIPLVQTVHDYQMICPNHVLYNFRENKICEKCLQGSRLNCVRNKCIHNSTVKSLIGAIEAKLYSVLKTYSKVDLFITPSNFLENKLLSANNLFQGKTKTIHNFIDKNRFSYQKVENDNYIAFAGRLSKEKGVEYLAETAKLLPEYTFIVAGDGPDKSVLENIPNIKLAGFLSGNELVNFIRNSQVLLMPSVCYENCPLSILEAQCMGVPTVTMNYGGMAELVQDGVTGVLAQDATPEGIASALRRALEDDNCYNTLKDNCKKEFKSILSIEEYCAIVVKEYERLIAR